MFKIIKSLIIICLLISCDIYANINSDLNHFFNNLGFDSNVSSPTAYHGQEAGFYTAGSLFARSSVCDVQIAHVELPSFSAGCGGIDFFNGSFSFINADKFISMMKNILNNAKGYAFNLALETATPEIAHTMNYLHTLANKINQSDINSCETAAGLVGSIWPRAQVVQKNVCEDIGTGGAFDDWASARQGCGAGGELNDTLNSGKSGPYQSMILQNTNIAWKAIQQNGFLASDTQLAEFFMSLSGSIVVHKEGSGSSAKNSFDYLPSLPTNKSLLKAILHGGDAKVYQCDTTTKEGCLNPTLESVHVAPGHSLEAQVRSLLNNMVNKIYSDQALSPEEIGLLQSTSLPVYKMLNVQAAFANDRNILDVSQYSSLIATDILFQYLTQNLNIVSASSSTMQYPESVMGGFRKGISQARQSLYQAQQNAFKQLSVSVQLIQRTQMIERMLTGAFSARLANSFKWANGLQ